MQLKQKLKAFGIGITNVFRKNHNVLVEIRGLKNEFLGYEKLTIKEGERLIDAFKKNPKFKIGQTSIGEIIQGYENGYLNLYEGPATKENIEKYKKYRTTYYQDFRKGPDGYGLEVYIVNNNKAHFITTSYNGMEYRPGIGNILYDSSHPLKLILKYTDFKEDIQNSYKLSSSEIKKGLCLPTISLASLQKDEKFLTSINYELSYFLNFEKKPLEIKHQKEDWIKKSFVLEEKKSLEFNKEKMLQYLQKYFIILFSQKYYLPFYFSSNYIKNKNKEKKTKTTNTEKTRNQKLNLFYKNFLPSKLSTNSFTTFNSSSSAIKNINKKILFNEAKLNADENQPKKDNKTQQIILSKIAFQLKTKYLDKKNKNHSLQNISNYKKREEKKELREIKQEVVLTAPKTKQKNFKKEIKQKLEEKRGIININSLNQNLLVKTKPKNKEKIKIEQKTTNYKPLRQKFKSLKKEKEKLLVILSKPRTKTKNLQKPNLSIIKSINIKTINIKKNIKKEFGTQKDYKKFSSNLKNGRKNRKGKSFAKKFINKPTSRAIKRKIYLPVRAMVR
ncbi:MAG: hypothetical protein ACK4J0_01655 [Candidatus Anstonellaceae archaeon]